MGGSTTQLTEEEKKFNLAMRKKECEEWRISVGYTTSCQKCYRYDYCELISDKEKNQLLEEIKRKECEKENRREKEELETKKAVECIKESIRKSYKKEGLDSKIADEVLEQFMNKIFEK